MDTNRTQANQLYTYSALEYLAGSVCHHCSRPAVPFAMPAPVYMLPAPGYAQQPNVHRHGARTSLPGTGSQSASPGKSVSSAYRKSINSLVALTGESNL